MLTHDLIRGALLAGTPIALACGLAGWFLVLRAEVFAADALSHVAFTGALAAAAAGIDLRAGLFVATVAVALGLGAAGERARADDALVGSIFAWVLGLGVLFLSIYTRSSSAGNGAAGVRVLFGSILGMSAGEARLAAAVGGAAALGLVALARPLLFASLDTEVARARGVRVRLLALLFLGIVGVTAAEATQAVGALMLLGLLSAPAGAAHRLSARPYVGLALSGALAVISLWGGIVVAELVPALPASSAIVAVAFAIWLVASLAPALRGRIPRLESSW